MTQYEAWLAQTDWKCPTCGAIHSPAAPLCLNCIGWKAGKDVNRGKKAEDFFIEIKKHTKAI